MPSQILALELLVSACTGVGWHVSTNGAGEQSDVAGWAQGFDLKLPRCYNLSAVGHAGEFDARKLQPILTQVKTMRFAAQYCAVPLAKAVDQYGASLLGGIRVGLAVHIALYYMSHWGHARAHHIRI